MLYEVLTDNEASSVTSSPATLVARAAADAARRHERLRRGPRRTISSQRIRDVPGALARCCGARSPRIATSATTPPRRSPRISIVIASIVRFARCRRGGSTSRRRSCAGTASRSLPRHSSSPRSSSVSRFAVEGLRQARRSAQLARIERRKADRVADFAQGMLAGIDPDKARGMDRSLMRLALDSAAERAGKELANQPAVRASVEHTMADGYAAIGRLSQSARTLRTDARARRRGRSRARGGARKSRCDAPK